MAKVLNKLTGQVEDLSEDEAIKALVEGGGTYDWATEQEIHRDQLNKQYGSTGQQALAAVESAVRTGTFGLVDGVGSDADIARRNEVLREESPGVAFASQALGTLVPGLGAGKAVGAGLKLAGAGARALQAGTIAAEGLASGSADEIEQARYEGRDVSPGNILLYGVGGEIAGRAIPAVLRRGYDTAARGIKSAAANVVGDTVENTLVQAEQKSLSRAARDVHGMEPGPERDALLTRTSDKQYDTAAREVRQSLDNIDKRWENLGDIPDKQYQKMVAPDAPVQMRWGTDTVQSLESISGATSDRALKTALGDAAQSLVDAEKGIDIFLAAKTAKNKLAELPASVERDQAIGLLKEGIEKQELFGKAAEFQSDLSRTADAFDVARAQVGKDLTQGEAFDPSKIRTSLKKDSVGRGLTEEQLMKQLDAVEDRIAVHKKWNTAGQTALESVGKDVQQARRGFSLADEIQGAELRQSQLPKPKSIKPKKQKSLTDYAQAKAGQIGGEMLETGVDMALGAFGLPPVAGVLRRVVGGIGENGKAAIGRVARQVVKPVVGESWAPVRNAVAQTALSRFQGEYPGHRESYEAKKNTLEAINRNPGVLAEAIGESFGSLPDEDPKLFQQLSGRLGQMFSYVKDNLPTSVATSMLYPRGIPPSEDSLRDFAILWNSVMDPESVMDDVAEGTATPDQIKHLKAMHPDIHQQLMDDIVTEVSNNFGEMDSQTKVWLDILFDADGIAGPGFGSQAAKYIQDSMVLKQNQPGTGGSNPGTTVSQVSTPAGGLNALKHSVTNRSATV